MAIENLFDIIERMNRNPRNLGPDSSTLSASRKDELISQINAKIAEHSSDYEVAMEESYHHANDSSLKSE